MEINIPPQQIYANSKRGAYNQRGGLMSSKYGILKNVTYIDINVNKLTLQEY